MQSVHFLSAALAALVLGCGGDDGGDGGGGDDLSVETVTHLPDGTGTGTAASGDYDVYFEVTACSGACSGSDSEWTISFCELGQVGPTGIITLTVTQSGGHLDVQNNTAHTAVHEAVGGIDQNGDFDVGGVNMPGSGDTITVTERTRGTRSWDHS